MRNKTTKSESVFKRKGFYIALYSCVGAVLILAAAISYGSLFSDRTPTSPDEGSLAQAEIGSLAQTGEDLSGWEAPDVEAIKSTLGSGSYLTPDDRSLAAASEEQDISVRLAQPETKDQATTAAADEHANESETAAAPIPEKPAQSVAAAEPTSPKTETASNTVIAAPVSRQADNGLVEPVFKSFSEGSQMSWPLTGEIVWDFSGGKLVYDVTLEHFRVNNNICIAAPIGSQVKASADGVVKSVLKTRENGNTVEIDHGNGWMTTYSQLQDSILVKEGDVVRAGQVIGGVASPSIYSILLGNHLSFRVAKDDKAVDPKSILPQ